MKKSRTNQMVFMLFMVIAVTTSWGVSMTQRDFMIKAQTRSAEKLFGEGKYEKAQDAYEQLAAGTENPVEKSMFKARAAIALGRQEDEYDSGIDKAKAIEHRPYSVYAQMQLMFDNKKYEPIISAFEDEDISEWPADDEVPYGIKYRKWITSPQNVKVYFYRIRGMAFYETGDGEYADRDLRRAADLCEGRSNGDHALKFNILRILSRNAEQHLGDDEKAFDAQMRIARETGQLAGASQYMRVVVSVASRLSQQGEFDEALEVLNLANLKDRRPDYWFGIGQLAYGRVYAAKAQAQYAEAVQLEKEDRYKHAEEMREEAGENEENALSYFKTLADEKRANERHREAAEEALDEVIELRPE